MSIKKCFEGTKFKLEGSNEELAAATVILEEFDKIKDRFDTVELEGVKDIEDFIDNNYNEPIVESQETIESLKDNKIEDFLSIENQDLTEEEVIHNRYHKTKLILFDNKQGKFTVSEILENIKANYPTSNTHVQDLIDNLIPKLATSNAKIKFISKSALINEKTLMQYNSATNEIQISKARLEDISTEQAVTTFLHEVVHSVTYEAYRNPKTIDEKIFKDYIDEMYNKYVELYGFEGDTYYKGEYGFKDPIEFIAEIMTNKAFQDNIKSLENGNLWNTFIAYIRSLLGLVKNPEYNKIVDSITSIIESSDYKGGLSNIILESQDFTKNKQYYKLDTITNKLSWVVNGIKDNLEENIKLYDYLIQRVKDPSKLETYNDKLKDLLNDIEGLDEARNWEAVSLFTTQLSSNLNSLKYKFENEDFTDKDILETIHIYDKYLQSHSLIGGMTKFIADAKANSEGLPITRDDLNTISETLSTAEGVYNTLEKDFHAHLKKGALKKFINRKFATKVIYNWKQKLSKEFDDLGYTGNKISWINNAMNTTYKVAIDKDVEDYVRNIIESPGFDISMASKLFLSGINTNSKLIQIFQSLINEIRENILTKTRTKDLELKTIFDKFIGEKGNKKPSELYKNLLEFDKNGKAYLKGEYKIEFKEAYEKAREVWLQEKKDKVKYKNSTLAKFINNNTNDIDGKLIPIDKWKNKLSDLTESEREALIEFRNITNETDKRTFGGQSLKSKYLFGQPYYSLPAITKSDLERVLEGNSKGILTDKWQDLTKLRTDDVGFEEQNTAMNGNPIYRIKVHYRGDLTPDQQSLDLFTLYRLEYKNGVNYEEKHDKEMELNTLVDIAKNKEYYRTTGLRVPVLGKFINRNKQLLIKGNESNTYKRMISLMESNVYDIMHKNAGKLGPLDTNKVIRVMNGWTASVGMTLNEVTAAANVLNGKAQLFLEVIAGNYITKSSLAKAEKLYFQKLPENLKDINSPVKSSFTNQLNDMFDTWGTVSVTAKQAFLKNGLLKANANGHSLQFMQESGEHWMQSVLTMAVLENIKVMDENSKFLDKNGKITTEDKSASLLDMMKMVDGKLQVNPKVVYTTRSLGVKYNEGGKELINTLIKKKIFDTMGNYDSNMQPEAMRHAGGKLLMMYRKYLIPMGVNRFRGMAYVNIDKNDLADEQKFFSEALQEYEEGTYTTTLRYVWNAALPAIKRLEFQLLSSKWNELSDFEKKNIHKAVTEIMITAILLPSLRALIELGIDDDDDKFMYFLLLETRRLESELAAYRDPREQYRILESPIPSVRMLQNGTTLMGRILDPTSWDEVYKSGSRKGEYKIRRNMEKLVPILNSRNVSYEEKYDYIVNAAQ